MGCHDDSRDFCFCDNRPKKWRCCTLREEVQHGRGNPNEEYTRYFVTYWRRVCVSIVRIAPRSVIPTHRNFKAEIVRDTIWRTCPPASKADYSQEKKNRNAETLVAPETQSKKAYDVHIAQRAGKITELAQTDCVSGADVRRGEGANSSGIVGGGKCVSLELL